MVRVIGVRFKKAGKIYYFDPHEIDVRKEQHVIVETVRGVEFGEVVIGVKEIQEEEIVAPLKKVLRVATLEDEIVNKNNKEKEERAFQICVDKIIQHTLDMKLIDVEYTFDNNKVIFYFTADGRVDFRELVKDLAAIFRTRIELRQIGVRDEAKMIGGIGPCGVSLCCSTWLGEFEPVSIKMAKEQNLSLNPTKISGICGRLMCCLKYEYETYTHLRKGMPNVGDRVLTEDGEGIVIDTSILLEAAKVRLIQKSKNGRYDLSDDVYVYNKKAVKVVKAEKVNHQEKNIEKSNEKGNDKTNEKSNEKSADKKHADKKNTDKKYDRKNDKKHDRKHDKRYEKKYDKKYEKKNDKRYEKKNDKVKNEKPERIKKQKESKETQNK